MMQDTSKAWSWRHAVTISSLPGECKHLLITLSLFMNEEGGSCFPEIETLMQRCSKGKTWVHKYLNVAEDAGWIIREQVHRKTKNGDNRGWRRNEYQARWPEQNLVTESTSKTPKKGGSRGELPSENVVRETQEGSSREGNNVVRQANTNIPYNIPQSLQGAGAQGGSGEPEREVENKKLDLKKVEQDFKGFFPKWPSYITDSEPQARKEWFALEAEEREQAMERLDDYVAAVRESDRKMFCSCATYLKERRWNKLPAPKPKRAGSHDRLELKPFGKAWMAYRLWAFDTFKIGDESKVGYGINVPGCGTYFVGRFDRQAARFPMVGWLDAGGKYLPNGHSTLGFEDFVQVAKGSEEYLAWEQWHLARDLPWINPKEWVEYIWMPQQHPDGFELNNIKPMMDFEADDVSL